MINYELHEEIKLLTQNCYNPQTNFLPYGWKLIKFIPNTSTGFKAGIYTKDEYVVIIYSGTDFIINNNNILQRNELLKDLITDEQLFSDKMPNQQNEAYYLYTIVKAMYPNYKIILGGHSLGGTLAQLVAFRSGAETVTFNAYAAGKILENNGWKNYSNNYNIYNYGNPTDPIFTHKFNKHVGRVLLTNLINDNAPEIVNPMPDDGYVTQKAVWSHNTESLGELKNAKDLTNYARSNPINAPIPSGVLKGAVVKVAYEPIQQIQEHANDYKDKCDKIIQKMRDLTAKRKELNRKLQDTVYKLKQFNDR